MAINKNPDGHKGLQFDYKGVKAHHAGDWDRQEYHSHHQKKREEIPEPPKPTKRVKPIPISKPEPLVNEALAKDLRSRNIKH